MVYLYNIIMEYYSEILKWSAATFYNMKDPWKHYAKGNKSVTKNHILYYFIYAKCPEHENLQK